MKYLIFSLGLLTITVQQTHGQTVPGPSGPVTGDSSAPRADASPAMPERPLGGPQLILPLGMVAYGITSLESDDLRDFNEEIKEEVWTEHSHKLVHLDNYLQWTPAAMVYGLNIAGIKGKNNFIDRSMIYFMSEAMLGTVVLTTKKITGEMRPDGSNRLSFPSGHTANAFAAAEFLRKEYQGVSSWYGVAGYAMAATTGFLRLYNNKHWLGDVIAGAGVGILSTNLAYAIYPKVKMLFRKQKNSHSLLFPMYQHGAAGMGFVYRFN